LRVFRGDKLARYGLDGTLVDERDVLASSVPPGKVTGAAFTPDARQLHSPPSDY
jgi:hypothetical protein